jgi:hypothetical protein
VPVKAGPHALGVAFLKNPTALLETARQPYQAHFNFYRHPRIQPAVYAISVIGPYAPKGPGETPSRKRLFVSQPSSPADQEPAAKRILAALMRRAYRRPVTDADLAGPLALFRQAQAEDGFDAGIEMALSAVLVSPEFLFRVEQDPADIAPDTAYRISDLELASRLSFFLWSSIPDDELLDLAIAGKLKEPAVLERQVRRMLADSRSESLVNNFASQWLHLRNLDSITPDMRCSRTSTTTSVRPSGRKPSSFSTASCARIAARSTLLRAQLHVRQRTAGQALRHPERVRQPLPAHHAGRRWPPGRPAAARQHPDGDLLCDADVAGHSRQVGARQHPRRAAAAAAARRAGAEGQHRRREPHGSQAARGAPHESGLRQLPQHHGPGRLVAREVRRHRPLARG